MSDLNALVSRLASETMALKDLNHAAAVADANHKRLRSKFAMKARAAGHSVAAAELTADADDEVADAHMLKVTSEATARSQTEMIRSLRTSVDAEQTVRADMRAADVAMARGYGSGS